MIQNASENRLRRLFRKHGTEIFFLLFVFCLFLAWALLIPYRQAPDEKMRYKIALYIYNYGKLPSGSESEIMNPVWGQSYAYQPILAYQIQAVGMHIGHFFGLPDDKLYIAARICNVLTGTATAAVLLAIGRECFKGKNAYLFAGFIILIPQFAFINSYVNNDALAFFSASLIVLGWIRGLKSLWSVRSCIFLGIGTGLCALSYYNAYGFILCSLILYLGSWIIRRHEKPAPFWLKHGLIVLGVFLAVCAWWFIRSAILHNGDFMGLRTVNALAEQCASPGYKPSQIQTPQKAGYSVFQMIFTNYNGFIWIKKSVMSFFASFGANNALSVNLYYYYVIFMITIVGLTAALVVWISDGRQKLICPEHHLFLGTMVLAGLIPFCIAVYYSYVNDYQPQGRYFLTALIPLAFFWSWGMQHADAWMKKHRFPVTAGYICLGGMAVTTFMALTVTLGKAYLGI
jgi:4-amino-4-deoxy-L-arabinose transferase-like glycosyltransferase